MLNGRCREASHGYEDFDAVICDIMIPHSGALDLLQYLESTLHLYEQAYFHYRWKRKASSRTLYQPKEQTNFV